MQITGDVLGKSDLQKLRIAFYEEELAIAKKSNNLKSVDWFEKAIADEKA